MKLLRRTALPLDRSAARTAEILLGAAIVVLLAIRLMPDEQGPFPPAESLVHRVDLNSAPWHELANLPGIGEVKARLIVADREANGPFADVSDLDRVKGIGPVTVDRIREFTANLR